MFEKLYKNPIIISLFVGMIVIIGTYYSNNKKNKKKKRKTKIDIIPVIIITLIVWFVTTNYFGINTQNNIDIDNLDMPDINIKQQLLNAKQSMDHLSIDNLEEIPELNNFLFRCKVT
jgi:cell division protein FtsB